MYMYMYTVYQYNVALADRTVKIWDMKSGQEVLTLDKHFSYVRCVRYCSKSRLIFTASQSLIKASVLV